MDAPMGVVSRSPLGSMVIVSPSRQLARSGGFGYRPPDVVVMLSCMWLQVEPFSKKNGLEDWGCLPQ